MNQYKVSDFLEKTFNKEPWWTFMGKYFGFPECCIDSFCNTEIRENSLFNGTGYVPCPCCNKKIHDGNSKKEFIHQINKNRLHNFEFGMRDNTDDNPHFFQILEDFYLDNNVFPYEDIIFRGGFSYFYDRFSDKQFSFLIYLDDKISGETISINIVEKLAPAKFAHIIDELSYGRIEKYKKIMTLEMLNMEETHTFNSKKTKKEIKKYNLEITQLLDKSYQAFKNKSLNNFPKPLIFSIK